MKRILILMHYMELGGAEAALLGLLQSHDPSRAQIDLFIYDHRGPLMEYIPTEKINILPKIPAYSLLERPITTLLKRGFFRLSIARLFGNIKTRCYAKNNILHLDDASALCFQQQQTVKVLPFINPSIEYDLALSFLTPHLILLNKVKAKKKIGWIHTDYSKIFINREDELKMWERLDLIASISAEAGNKFLSVFPALKTKIITIENIISPSFIRRRANVFMPQEMNMCEPETVKLLSIGRYCTPKRFDEVGTICRMLKEHLGEVFNFKWYIIGYGSDVEEKKIINNINMERMQGCVTVLGKKDNPYPYLKACDIYVQPSRFEGKSITVREAQILCKPVLVANYPTAMSQVIDGLDGVIAPFENKGIARSLADFIKNKERQKQIVEYLETHDYGNVAEIDKIYSLLESTSVLNVH